MRSKALARLGTAARQGGGWTGGGGSAGPALWQTLWACEPAGTAPLAWAVANVPTPSPSLRACGRCAAGYMCCSSARRASSGAAWGAAEAGHARLEREAAEAKAPPADDLPARGRPHSHRRR